MLEIDERSREHVVELRMLDWDDFEINEPIIDLIIDSMQTSGIIENVITFEKPNGRYGVVAGRHRCVAAQRSGWDKLRVTVIPYETSEDRLRAQIITLDENLARRTIPPAERALLTERRKAIYDELHPGAEKKGGPKGEGPAAYADFAGAKGRAPRSVRRDVMRGKELGPEALNKIKGTSLDKGEELDALMELPPEKRTELIEAAAAGKNVSAKTAKKQVQRAHKEAALAGKQLALPEKRYGVIYADPPWRYEVYSRETGLDRAADNHYPTMTIETINALDVEGTLAAEDSVLFLWTTVPFLAHAQRAMKHWGFSYVSLLAWAKEKVGTGHWVRNNVELLLIGRRGNVPAPAPGTQFSSIVEVEGLVKAPVGRHSEKPEIFRQMIEELYPTLPRLEMFAREKHPGWDVWGDEVANADDRDSPISSREPDSVNTGVGQDQVGRADEPTEPTDQDQETAPVADGGAPDPCGVEGPATSSGAADGNGVIRDRPDSRDSDGDLGQRSALGNQKKRGGRPPSPDGAKRGRKPKAAVSDAVAGGFSERNDEGGDVPAGGGAVGPSEEGLLDESASRELSADQGGGRQGTQAAKEAPRDEFKEMLAATRSDSSVSEIQASDTSQPEAPNPFESLIPKARKAPSLPDLPQ